MREIIIARKDTVQPEHVSIHQPYEYIVHKIASESMGNQCEVRIYVLPPGKANYPYHYHSANEEIFYIISGSGILETPDGERLVSAGDVLVFPPGERGAHKLSNPSETEPLAYLDVDVLHSPEVAFYPHSQKIGVFTDGFRGIYRQDIKVPYYEGE